MQKWEYCVVGPIKSYLDGSFPGLYFINPKGFDEKNLTGGDEQKKIAACIAQLGEDGWEMIGCGNVGEAVHMLYFKRPKP